MTLPDIRFKRGTTAKNDAYVGVDSTISIDKEAKNIRVHNGLAAGGAFKIIDETAVDSKISNAIAGMTTGGVGYKGTWNASTNTPTIPAAKSSNKGWYYKVATAGATSIDGIADWGVGDWIISNGATWDKVDNTDSVSTVNGKSGAVVLNKSDIGLSNVDNTADSAKAVLSASKLTSARTINGVEFDGSANITVYDPTKAAVGNTIPSANGTAAAGTSSNAARADHVHPLQTSVSGNAGTATKLATARTISISGDVTGSVVFDGSGNANITATLATIDCGELL